MGNLIRFKLESSNKHCLGARHYSQINWLNLHNHLLGWVLPAGGGNLLSRALRFRVEGFRENRQPAASPSPLHFLPGLVLSK